MLGRLHILLNVAVEANSLTAFVSALVRKRCTHKIIEYAIDARNTHCSVVEDEKSSRYHELSIPMHHIQDLTLKPQGTLLTMYANRQYLPALLLPHHADPVLIIFR